MRKIEELEKSIDYYFNNTELIKNALTHSSYANELQVKHRKDNERLEFLGDAVLELIISDYLYKNHSEDKEGRLSKIRASIVCEQTLFILADKFELGTYLFLGKGEEMTGGRERHSVVSDAFEALIGAIYLDGGIKQAEKFINNFIIKNINEIELFYDCKTSLQELIQSKYDETLNYVLAEEKGPDHDKHFVSHAMLGKSVIGIGEGHTKKAAEQDAAYKALLKLRSLKG